MRYEEPNLNIIVLEKYDVITLSGGNTELVPGETEEEKLSGGWI